MYLIFNRDGSLGISNLEDYVMQGNSNVNFIYVAFDDETNLNATAIVNITRPDNETIALPTLSTSFIYNGKTYYGWVATLDNTCTAIAGLLQVNVSLVSGNSELVSYTYNLVVNETSVAGESNINLAQFRSLLATISGMRINYLGEHESLEFLDEIVIPFGIYGFSILDSGYLMNYYKNDDKEYQTIFTATQEAVSFYTREKTNDVWGEWTTQSLGDNFVDLLSNQTINGIKSFYDVINANGGIQSTRPYQDIGTTVNLWENSYIKKMHASTIKDLYTTKEVLVKDLLVSDDLLPFKEEIQNKLDIILDGLFETIWVNSTATFERLNVATVNRTDDDKAIVSNQYAGLNEIGAFSYVENQLVNPNNYANKEINGVSITVNKETGVITFNGTCSSASWAGMGNIPTLANHKYLVFSTNKTVEVNINGTTFASGNYWKMVKSTTDNPTAYYSFYLGEGQTYNNVSFTFKIVDLTIMGLDSITTVEEWEALGIEIPSEYVAPHIVSSRPTLLKSYSEFAETDMEDLTYSAIDAADGKFAITSQSIYNPNGAVKCSIYETVTFDELYNGSKDKCIARATNGFIWIRDTSKANMTTTEFKNSVTGGILYYAPQNPTDAEVLGDITITLPQQFISAGNAKDIVKAVAKANGLYDLFAVSYVGSVLIPDLPWVYGSNGFSCEFLDMKNVATLNAIGLLCPKYTKGTASEDKSIRTTGKYIGVVDSAYVDVDSFKSGNAGVPIYYEEALPTITIIATDLTEEQLKFIIQKGCSVALDVPGCDVKLDVVAIDYRE